MSARVTNRRGRANYLKKGDNNVECDRTGFKMKSGDCRFEWTGHFIRRESFEERQPQDLLRGFPDRQQPNVSRPGTGDTFVGTNDVQPGDL